jgi:SAM-dependent methyltransferase
MQKIFDIKKLQANRLRARENMDGHDFLFKRAAEILSDNLDDITRDPQDILVVGIRGYNFLKEKLSNKNIVLFDVSESDNEIPQLEPQQFDCVISLPYLHSVNDVKGFLMAIKQALKPDGFFLCSYFGGESLKELRASILHAETEKTGGASQHIHPMIDHYQFAGLLQLCGFALPVVNFDRVTVEYSDLNNLYNDLKNMGEGNALANRRQNIHAFKQEVENYYKNHFFNKGYVATFDIVHGIGWAPHESQQKPARRGSAEVSLTEVL